jgi:hypothetical protein
MQSAGTTDRIEKKKTMRSARKTHYVASISTVRERAFYARKTEIRKHKTTGKKRGG